MDRHEGTLSMEWQSRLPMLSGAQLAKIFSCSATPTMSNVSDLTRIMQNATRELGHNIVK